jgi:hypothetical protein
VGAATGDTASFDAETRCRSQTSEDQFRHTLTKAQLIACIDVMAQHEGGWQRDGGDYQAELTRRETERQSKRLEWLTEVLLALTIVIVIATLVLVWSELQH